MYSIQYWNLHKNRKVLPDGTSMMCSPYFLGVQLLYLFLEGIYIIVIVTLFHQYCYHHDYKLVVLLHNLTSIIPSPINYIYIHISLLGLLKRQQPRCSGDISTFQPSRPASSTRISIWSARINSQAFGVKGATGQPGRKIKHAWNISNEKSLGTSKKQR